MQRPAARGAYALQQRETSGPLLGMVLEHVQAGQLDRDTGAAIVAGADWIRGLKKLVEDLGGEAHKNPIPKQPKALMDWLAEQNSGRTCGW